ncbi:cytochrome P450 2J4-like isoform X2 [Eublepharis macularius]|uniref:Cytochrome P450 2J4-like isoform X2 n=1 Tax=Eublepharis macularius TaxID=481883 RepID=A0AA97L299_EUBMA|nr:cytochrome P450 2J4-like isoform X2 [Eublepharis macularius]
MWIPATLISVLACLLIMHFLKQCWSHKNYPPGPLRLPLIGSIWRIIPNFSQDTFIKLAKQYGNIYTIWAGSLPVVVLSGIETVKEGVVKHSEYFDERPETPFFKALGNENGIGLSNGHTWKQQRKFAILILRKLGLGKKGIEHKIEEEAHQLVETFARAKGQPLDPSSPVSNSVTNVICSLIFGQRFSLKDEEFIKLKDALWNIIQFSMTFFQLLYDTLPWLMKHLPGPHKKVFASRDFISSFARKEVEKHKTHRSLVEPQDFIDYYLLQIEKSKKDPDSSYNEENLSQCICDLFAAGTETITHILLWALVLMANHPDIQEKVQKEIDEVLGSSKSFSYQNWKKLPYTSAVIHEIQRFKYILLFGVPRQCSKDVNIMGFLIPEGAIVIPDARCVLFDPKHWETPQEFNPNNFLDKDGKFVEKEEFLLFGAGARTCIGQQLARIELFIFFISLLRSFTFKPPEGVKKINEEPVLLLVTFPHPYTVCAVPRSTGSS